MEFNVDISDLNKKQLEIATFIDETPAALTKYHIIRASRQSGKTFLISRLSIFFALLRPKKIVAFVNAQHKQNRKVYTDMLDIIPDTIIRKAINNDGDRSIEFINGSIIFFYTAKNYNAIVGSTFDYFIGDEFALWPLQAWDYIQPTVAAKPEAKVILSSTPRGKNHFYNLCMEGQSSDPFKEEHRMLYTDNSNYDLREVADAKKYKPDSVWRQEYLAEFVFGKGQVFGNFKFAQTISEWGDPQEGVRYTAAIDVAATGDDATVLTIVDQTGKVCYIFEPNDERIPAQADEIIPVLKMWNADCYVECNGLGIGLFDTIALKYDKVSKFWMTNERKQQMVTQFLKDLIDGYIQLPNIELYPKLDNEMSTYEVSRLGSGKLSYAHAKGLHDDTVDSMLIANFKSKTYGDFVYEEQIEVNGITIYPETDYLDEY